jgi:glycosyltransferase involved in cell wall biosynthesis
VSDTRRTHIPRVSVVIATYNWATVLPSSIGSVLDQSFGDFELLVVGDGCTDESAAVVESIGDSRVRWINLPQNTGHQAGPNNEGQRQACGEIIAYLGHDDLWLPNHLALLVTAIDCGAAFAHSSVLHVDPHHHPTVTPCGGWTYSRGDWLPPTSVAVPRTTLERIGGWRMPRHTGSLDPDADVWARAFDATAPPIWVQHLTCVKLPAARRKNVYRTRPNAEQRYWLEKIRSADDPQAAMLATVGVPYDLRTEVPDISFHVRAWRSLRYRARKHLRLGVRSQARIRRNRRYKGL